MQRFRAVSRKTHRTAAIFDLNFPLTGEAAVECRNGGGNYSFIFTFGTNVISGAATVTLGCSRAFPFSESCKLFI